MYSVPTRAPLCSTSSVLLQLLVLTTFTFHILLFPCWEGWRSLYPVSIPQRTSFGKRIPEAIATEGRGSAQKSAGLLSLSVAKLEMWRHKQLNVYFLDRVCLKLLCHTRALDASPLHLSFPNPALCSFTPWSEYGVVLALGCPAQADIYSLYGNERGGERRAVGCAAWTSDTFVFSVLSPASLTFA